MGVFSELQKAMKLVQFQSNHQGHYYSVSNVLAILVCGMLCGLRTIDDIHQWM